SANQRAFCEQGSCRFRCEEGFVDCNGNPGDGCEAELARDDANCGMCGSSCRDGEHCVDGQCERWVVAGISTSGDHTCAWTESGRVACWGANGSGQLGIGPHGNRTTPTPVLGLNEVIQVSAGLLHTCALRRNGRVYCWGSNELGQLGVSPISGRTISTPVQVPDIEDAIAVRVGRYHSCALLQSRRVRCWGGDIYHSLGEAEGAASEVISFDVGSYHGCALTQARQVMCWGSNWNGQLGDGMTGARRASAPVLGLSNMISVGLGDEHSCAIHSDGTGSCWGSNTGLQLGDGTNLLRRLSPVMVRGLRNAVEIDGGGRHTCALLQNRTMRCWGDDSYGQLGDGESPPSSGDEPPMVMLDNIISFSVGGQHTCALRADRSVWCWGQNTWGQLGDGSTENRNHPVRVSWF
ncbi:MAG: hypothetical protein RMJ84_10790, partial [Sandaracinaceae bacterium]|nr:hypothetical protein [Sandaracinaceae bacterium]